MKQWMSLLVAGFVVGLVVAAMGCGGAKPDPLKLDPKSTDPSYVRDEEPAAQPVAEPAKPAAPARDYSCAEAQANVAAFTLHVSKTLSRTLGAHCVQDKWQQEVINCFAATQNGPDLNLCTALLTPEQQRALETQNVSDAVDPNAPRDPACAVLDGTKPVPPAAGGVAGKPVPLPTLGLPRSGKQPAPGTAPATPTPTSAPRTYEDDGAQRRTVAPKELEALRVGGDAKIGPDAPDQQLVEKCDVTRVNAVLKLCIDAQGEPLVIKLLRSSRLPGYDAKLASSMRAWRYKPFLADGKAVEVCTAVTFIFALQ